MENLEKERVLEGTKIMWGCLNELGRHRLGFDVSFPQGLQMYGSLAKLFKKLSNRENPGSEGQAGGSL